LEKARSDICETAKKRTDLGDSIWMTNSTAILARVRARIPISNIEILRQKMD
jgi:hypothetical protein